MKLTTCQMESSDHYDWVNDSSIYFEIFQAFGSLHRRFKYRFFVFVQKYGKYNEIINDDEVCIRLVLSFDDDL